MYAAQIKLTDVSIYNPPRGDYRMAILKAYLDDSGDPVDPNHSIVGMAGYAGTADGWEYFDAHWPKVLAAHKVPYLHMKELWNRDGIYKEMKSTPGAEAAFLGDCVNTISIATEDAVTAMLRLEDYRRFEEKFGLGLDPMALALYGCLVELRSTYPKEEIHVVIDRISKPYKCIETAKRYARTDTWQALNVDQFLITPLEGDDTFRRVLPIQAADFVAWEIRRNMEEKKSWRPAFEDRQRADRLDRSFVDWKAVFEAEKGRPLRERMSGRMLSAYPRPHGNLWDDAIFHGVHLNRHKNGWED